MKNITKEDWKKLVKETDNAVVIDVRTPEEWAEGIQPNAKQLNFLSLVDFLSEIDSLDKSNTYFLYCRSGKRSAQACMYMYDKGFTTYNLMGGMLSWDGEVVK
jgi:rhodanese-related sulfurtransferase